MENSDFTFSLLDRSSAARLNAINRACPIESDFTLVFDRGDDFFRWPDLVYDRYQYLGVFHEGELIGYLLHGLFCGWMGGRFGLCGYLGDARVLPAFRGRNLTQQMMNALEAYVPPDSDLGFSVVKKGNLPAEALALTACSAEYRPQPLGDFHALNIPLLRPPRGSTSLTIRNAQRSDLGAMAELFARCNAGRLFAPPLSKARLEHDLERLSFLGLNDYWLAEDRGHLVGMLAACDLSPVHSTQLLRYSLAGRVIRVAYNAAARLSPGVAGLPPPGGMLRILTITRVAIQDQSASTLRAMLSHLVRASAGKGFHLLSIGFPAADPLMAAARGFFLVQHFVSTLNGVSRNSWIPAASESLPYVDLLMI